MYGTAGRVGDLGGTGEGGSFSTVMSTSAVVVIVDEAGCWGLGEGRGELAWDVRAARVLTAAIYVARSLLWGRVISPIVS
jgi:hypothetical protein